MSLDARKNFCEVLVSAGYNASATSIILASGDGSKLPQIPFNLVWYNSSDYSDPAKDPNVEIVRVTAIVGDTLTITRAQESTSAKTHNSFGVQYAMILSVTANTIDQIESAINGAGGPSRALAKLSGHQQKMLPPLIQAATPAAGQTITLATLTGQGIINLLWLTLSDNDSAWNNVLQVFYDGELTPSFEADLGTLFLTHLSGHTILGGAYTTEHMFCGPYGPNKGNFPNAMSGGIRFPMPYSDGVVIKLKAPAAGTAAGTQNLYVQIAYQEGITSNLRLCSKNLPWLSKATYTNTDIITFFDLQNTAGWLVWMSAAIKGASNITYLERVWFFGVDGEDTTPDGNGVVTTDFSCSGGEDLWWSGWYFLGLNQISGEPASVVTATNNAGYETVAGFDFLAAYGGLKFTKELKPGWSLKPGNFITTSHDMAWLFLYYKDTSIPFAPTAPGLSASAGDGQITYTLSAPNSTGSTPLTKYTVTVVISGVPSSYDVTIASPTLIVSGLTNGVTYSATATASNSIGISVASSAQTATPAVGVPVITVQPASQAINLESSVTFSVTATGTVTGYQWKKGGVNISGAVSSSYTISSVLSADAATYTVVVTGPGGSVTSSGAVLTINAISFIASVTGGTPRNDATIDGGIKFSINTQITVTHLSRFVVSGNSATHAVKLYNSDATSLLGSVTVATSGVTARTFASTALGSPVVLTPGTYIVLSSELTGGDQWLNDDNTLTTTADGAFTIGVFEFTPGDHTSLTPVGGGGSFGPTSFKYLR